VFVGNFHNSVCAPLRIPALNDYRVSALCSTSLTPGFGPVSHLFSGGANDYYSECEIVCITRWPCGSDIMAVLLHVTMETFGGYSLWLP
jgi:hypothetical protein